MSQKDKMKSSFDFYKSHYPQQSKDLKKEDSNFNSQSLPMNQQTSQQDLERNHSVFLTNRSKFITSSKVIHNSVDFNSTNYNKDKEMIKSKDGKIDIDLQKIEEKIKNGVERAKKYRKMQSLKASESQKHKNESIQRAIAQENEQKYSLYIQKAIKL